MVCETTTWQRITTFFTSAKNARAPRIHLLSPQAVLMLVNLMAMSITAALPADVPRYQRDWVAALLELLTPNHRNRLAEWPATYGGGDAGVLLLGESVARVLYLPFVQTMESSGGEGSLTSPNLDAYFTLLFELRAEILLFEVCTGHASGAWGSKSIQVVAGLACTLAANHESSCRRAADELWGQADPRSTLLLDRLLTSKVQRDPTEIDMVSAAVSMIAQIARLTANYYPVLAKLGALPRLSSLLASPTAELRCKACNAIGNLFRHSDFFYDEFSQCDGTGSLYDLTLPTFPSLFELPCDSVIKI